MNVLLGFSRKPWDYLLFLDCWSISFLIPADTWLMTQVPPQAPMVQAQQMQMQHPQLPEDFAVVNTQPSAFIDNLWIEFL